MRDGRMCTGGDSPSLPLTVRDWCSGAMARQESPCHGQPQEQYNVTQHIPCPKQSRDWSFPLHYNAGPTSPMWDCMWEITGCTIAGNPIGYADLTGPTGNSTLPEPDESNNKKDEPI